MAKLLHKRSATPAKVPLTTDLTLGELSVNTNDGKLFLKKNNGADSIVEVGAQALTGDVTGSGNGTIPTTLANSGVTAGTYTKVTVDAKGRATAGTNMNAADVTTSLGYTPESVGNRNIANGYAGLDATGKVLKANLPSDTNAEVVASLGFTPENIANKNANNGYVGLDASGKIPNSVLPPLAISTTSVVASQAAMLALTAETGDVCVRTDLTKTYILTGTGNPTVLGNWQELLNPPGSSTVTSVNSKVGAVVLSTDDVAEGATNQYYTAGRVRSTSLTGIDLTTNALVSAADGVMGAIGKLQKQTTDLKNGSQGFVSLRDFVNGTLVTTSINYAVSSGSAVLCEITGNSYGQAIPFNVKIQGYIYNDTFMNHGGISSGTNIPGIVVLNVGGNLCFWWPRIAYWHGFTVFVSDVMTTTNNRANNLVTSITDQAKPAGTKEVAISVTQAWTAANLDPLPKSGGAITGTLSTLIPGNVSAVTSLNGGGVPIYVSQSVVPSNGTPSYTPFIHNTTALNGQGYVQHVSIGAYRPGTIGWAGAIYMGIGGSDNNVTEAYLFNYGRTISHTGGVVNITGNATYALNSTRLYATGGNGGVGSGYGYQETSPYYMSMTFNSPVNRWRLSVSPATPAAVEVAYADNAGTVSGLTIGSSANPTPSGGNSVVQNTIGYVQGMSILGQTDGALYSQAHSAPYQHQIYGDYRTGQMAVRGKNADAWQPWRTVIDSGNIAAQNVDGAAKVWINTDEAYTGVEYITLNRGGGMYASQYNTAKLSFVPSTGNLRAQNGFYTDLNSTYAKNLYIGNMPSSGANQASVAVTNGNLHIDPTTGNYATYLSFYSGTGGTQFGDGAAGIVASVSGAGVFSGSGAGLTGSALSLTAGAATKVTCPDGDRDAATKLPTGNGGQMVRFDFNEAASTGTGGSYAGVMTFAPWSGTAASTGGCSYQMAYGSTVQNGGTPQLRIRNGIDSTWNAWYDVWTSANAPMSVAASPNTIVFRDASGYIQGGTYMLMSDEGVNGLAGTVSSIICKRGDNYYRSTSAQSVKNFLGVTGADVYSVRTNTDSFVGVCREMAWRNYGNSHTIFDASNGLSPSGSAVNNTNSANPWSATFPTLMGWNGASTYGVRVDVSRTADTLNGYAPSVAVAGSTIVQRDGSGYMNSAGGSFGRVVGHGVNRGSYGSISVTGVTNTYAGIDLTDALITFMGNGIKHGVYYDNSSWLWNCDNSGNFTAFGNVTAYSDERLKTNWRDVQSDFVAQWAGIKHGTYDRVDVESTQVGLSAQDVQAILPYAVSEGIPTIDGDVFLTLNYGSAAAVATVELAKKAMEQEHQIKYLTDLVQSLITRINVLESK